MLKVNFKEEMGKWYEELNTKEGKKKYEFTICKSNAMCAVIYFHKDLQEKEEIADLFNFFLDKEHAKRCLGITKGYDNNVTGLRKVKLNTNYKEMRELAKLLIEANFENLTIETYRK